MTLDFAYLYAKHFKISMEYIFCLTDDPTPIPRLPIVKVEEPVEEKKPEPIIMRQPIHVRDSVALQPRDEMILLSKERLRGVRDRRKWSRQEMVDAIAKTVGGVTFTVEDLEDFESGKRLAIIPVILGYSLFSRLSLDYLLGLAPDTRQPKRNSSIEVRGLLVKVGARLKELRERNGASTVDMVIEAVYCNIPCITRAAIEVLEQGNIVTDLVYMYSRRFNVSMEYLFCLTEQPGTFQHPAASDAPSGKVLSLVERNGSKVETKEVAAPKAKIVGTRMKNLREHYKISIETCAESGERAGYITQYESGDLMAPASYVSWFADFFDISIDYLFGRIDDSTGAIFSGKPKFVRDREALEAEAKNFLTSLGSSNWSPELQEVLKEALA
jgi:repressor LexA